MALTIQEAWKSGEGTLGRSSQDQYRAIVSGDPVADNADDPATVMLFAMPKFSAVSALGNIIHDFTRERIAPGKWIITANYQSPTLDRQTNDSSFSFSIGGGTQHITHSIATVHKYSADKSTPPDYQGAIGVTQDSIEGVDIDAPAASWRTTFYLGSISDDYMKSLKASVAKVNTDEVVFDVDGVHIAFDPGELKLKGAEGSKRNGFSDWEICLSWESSPNAANLTIGPITGIVKDGWDYLWVKYKPTADDNTSTLLQQPQFVYIEQVYPRVTLSKLVPQGALTVGWLNPVAGGAPL